MSLEQIKKQAREMFDETYKKKGTRLSFLAKGARDEINDFMEKQLTTAYTAGIQSVLEKAKEMKYEYKTKKRQTPFQDTLFNHAVNVLDELLSANNIE